MQHIDTFSQLKGKEKVLMKPYGTLCSELKTNHGLKFHFINFAKSFHSKKGFLIRDMTPKEKIAQTPA